MKSVVYVTTTFPTMAVFLENEVRRLSERGVSVEVLTLRHVGREYQPDHAPLLEITRPVGSPLSPVLWFDLLRWLVRRPHVLVPDALRLLWASRGSLYAFVGHAGYLPAAARVATLVERAGHGRVHGAWAHFPATVAYLASRLTGVRFSMAGHAGSDLYRTQAFLDTKVRAADFVTACVRENAEMLRRLAGNGAGRSVHWIYHGVDRSRFDGSGRARDTEPLLLAVGRLARTKGYDVLIEAMGQLAARGCRPKVVMVGDGPERGAFERRVRDLGLGTHVEFAGSMAQTELLDLYRRAWFLVAPSRELPNGRKDGIPNVIVEALAMGLPCLGTRAAGLEEAIEHGVNGTLVAPDDPDALARAIEELVSDPGGLDRMGRAATTRVAETFDAESNFERLYALMQGAPS